jgi:hypothetical protein
MHSPSFSALAISLGILTLGLPAAPAQGEPAAPTAPHRARFTVDTPIADLMANPGARAVVEKVTPGLESNPHYVLFRFMSLRQIAPMSAGKLTDAHLAQLDQMLAKVP